MAARKYTARKKGGKPPKGIPLGLGMEHPGLLKTPLSKPTMRSGEVRPPQKPPSPIAERRQGAKPLSELSPYPAKKRVKPLSELPLGLAKKRVKPRIGIPPQVKPIKLKPAPGRSPKLKWNIKKR